MANAMAAYASFDAPYADDLPLLERGEAVPSSSSSSSSSSVSRNAGTPPGGSSRRRGLRTAAAVFAAVVLVLIGVVALLVPLQLPNNGSILNFAGQTSSSSSSSTSTAPKGGSSEQQAAAAEKKSSGTAAASTSSTAMTSKIGSNNTPPPTPAPTYLTTMVYVIQRVDGVTLEQSLDSTFESAFVTGILKGSSMKLTLVKYVESKSALYGAGVDCEYFVEAKDTNPEELTSVVRSSAVTDAMITSLQGAGYKEATCSAQAIIVDVSPTSAPTYTPTYSKAYVEVKQHVDGVSVADAESQPFASAVQEAIAGSLQIPEEDVFFQGAEEQGGSGVQITYVVALRNTDVNTLRRPLESTHTSSALTSALKLSGFDAASAQPVADVLDVSPTSAPTPFQTLAMVALKAKQAIYGVTYTQANTETFSGAFKAGVAAALGIDDDAVVVESVEGTPLSATIVYVTFDVYQEKADFDGVETKLQSEAARETLGKTLIAATGYAITMPLPCEATDYSPTPVPTARPTNKITVLKVVQRVDGITEDEVKEDEAAFDTAIVNGVVAAGDISVDTVTITSVEQARFSKNAVDVTYTVMASGMNSLELADKLTTEAAATTLTTELTEGGFKYAECATAAVVTDLSPTPVPTGRPTQTTTIMQVAVAVAGVTSAQATSATFTTTLQRTIANECDVPLNDVYIGAVDAAADGKGVAVAYSVQAQGTNSATLGGCLASKDLASHLSSDLVQAGYTAASVAAGVVTDLSPTGAPSYMPTQLLTLVRAVQAVSHLSIASANEATFTNAFQRSVALTCAVPIGNVNIVSVATIEGKVPGVDVSFTVGAPDTNYVELTGKLESPDSVESLSLAIQKAGYRDAWVDSAPSFEDASPTYAPTPATTLKLVVLTATQEVSGVSVSDAATSTFQKAFQAGATEVLAAADPDITTADVKLTTITAEATGDGVAVSFQVQAKDASPKQLEDAIVSASMANRINTELHAAGFHDAEAHGRADIVDSSPTGAPSSMPTQAELTVRVEQRVDGLTPAQAGTEIFTVVLKKCVANALSLGDDGDHVVFLDAAQASDNKNSVYVTYQVKELHTNMYYLSGQLASADLRSGCTTAMQTNGFATAQMLEQPTVADLSPTMAPTVNPHYPTMAPTVNPKCGEYVVVLFTQRVDNVNIMQASSDTFIREFMAAVAKGSHVPADDLEYIGQTPAKYGVAVDMIYQANVPTSMFPDATALIDVVKSAEVTEAEADALEELGLTDASCAAEVIPKDLCV